MIYILIILASTVALWLAGKFSADPPNLYECLIGACVTEGVRFVLGLVGLPSILSTLIALSVLIYVLIKFARFSGVYAFLAAILYGVIQQVIIMLILLR